MRQNVAPQNLDIREDRNFDHVADDLPQENAARERRSREFAERLPVVGLVPDEHINPFDGHVEQVGVVDLFELSVDLLDKSFAPAADDYDVAGLQHCFIIRVYDFVASANTLSENPQVRERLSNVFPATMLDFPIR